jgi:hypothetical protein
LALAVLENLLHETKKIGGVFLAGAFLQKFSPVHEKAGV